MSTPRILGPENWPGAFAPAFEVAVDPGWFYAVELASRAELFDAAAHGRERTPDSYFASWGQQPLLDAPSFTPPGDAWARLARTGSVAYRAHASRQRDRWEAHTASTRDEDARSAPRIATFPLAWHPGDLPVAPHWPALWSAAMADPGASSVRQREAFEAVLCRHATSPRRPTTPGALEWVLVATHAASPRERVEAATLRLAFETLRVLGRSVSSAAVAPGAPLDPDAAARAMNALPAHLHPWPRPISGASLERLGRVWVWQDLAPPPGQAGGTALLHGLSGELLYAASTEWGGGTVWWPA